MPCTVTVTEHGYLQYRLRSKAIPGYESKESTGIPNDREHRDERRKMERHAKLMSAEMAAGKFDYLAWFPNGSKAHGSIPPARRMSMPSRRRWLNWRSTC